VLLYGQAIINERILVPFKGFSDGGMHFGDDQTLGSGAQIPEGDAEKTEQRTKEMEIKANVDFWKGLGIEVNEEDVRREIEAVPEVEGFNWYLYIPKSIKPTEMIEQIRKTTPVWCTFEEALKYDGAYYDDPENDLNIDNFNSTRNSQDTEYAISARYKQYPDEDSVGEGARCADEWAQTGEDYMTMLEWFVAEMRWHQENDSHLDQRVKGSSKTITPNDLCKGEKGEPYFVPRLDFDTDKDRVYISKDQHGPNGTRDSNGIRRVITKTTEPEIIAKIKSEIGQ